MFLLFIIIVSGSEDGTIRIWSADTGKSLLILKDHEDEVECVCFSPDGEQIASASEDHTVKIWNSKTG